MMRIFLTIFARCLGLVALSASSTVAAGVYCNNPAANSCYYYASMFPEYDMCTPGSSEVQVASCPTSDVLGTCTFNSTFTVVTRYYTGHGVTAADAPAFAATCTGQYFSWASGGGGSIPTPGSISPSPSPGSTPGAQLSTQVTNSMLFAFAAANYPDLLSGTPTSGQYQQYIYRLYPDTGNILGVDTTNDSVVIYGPYVGNVVVNLGPKSNLLSAINAWEAQGKPVTPPGKTGVSGTRETVSVKGLKGGELVVANNVGDALSITRDGTYTFATPYSAKVGRVEQITRQPAGQQACKFTKSRIDVIDPYTQQLITPNIADVYCFDNPCGSALTLGNAPAPTGLRILETTGEAVRLEWQGQPWATDYGVYCGTDPNTVTDWGNKRESVGMTNVLRGNLQPNTQYYCAVTSFYSSPANLDHCQSRASTLISAKTKPAGTSRQSTVTFSPPEPSAVRAGGLASVAYDTPRIYDNAVGMKTYASYTVSFNVLTDHCCPVNS